MASGRVEVINDGGDGAVRPRLPTSAATGSTGAGRFSRSEVTELGFGLLFPLVLERSDGRAAARLGPLGGALRSGPLAPLGGALRSGPLAPVPVTPVPVAPVPVTPVAAVVAVVAAGPRRAAAGGVVTVARGCRVVVVAD